jgi:capsular polysaccharide biosynthesis protein
LIRGETFENFEIDFDHLIRDESSRPLIIGYNVGWYGYYHWLTQSLPAIDHSTRRRESEVRIALPALSPWQLELLDLLGAGGLERVKMNFFRHYSATHVEYSQFLNGATAYQISRKASETFLKVKTAAVVGDREGPRAIYIARADTKNRQMTNEDELVTYLSSNGVEIVYPTSLSVRAQINRFAHASVVIGPHGGGLSNIVFCRQGASVYELFSDHYVNPCYYILAQGAGLNYWADMFSASGEGNLHAWSWEVDMEIFKKRFAAIMSQLEIGGLSVRAE